MAFPELNIKSVNIIKSMNGNSRGFGYVHLESVVSSEFQDNNKIRLHGAFKNT